MDDKWKEPVDLTEEPEAVKVVEDQHLNPKLELPEFHGRNYATIEDYERQRREQAQAHKGEVEEGSGVEIRNAPPKVARLKAPHTETTPEGMRKKALARAVGMATVAASALESSVEWLAVDDAETAKEYHDLIGKVEEYQERLSNRYDKR